MNRFEVGYHTLLPVIILYPSNKGGLLAENPFSISLIYRIFSLVLLDTQPLGPSFDTNCWIEHLPLVQKLQLIVKAQLFLLKSVIAQTSQVDCDLTHLGLRHGTIDATTRQTGSCFDVGIGLLQSNLKQELEKDFSWSIKLLSLTSFSLKSHNFRIR